MPVLHLEIKNTYKSVIRAACLDVAKQMMLYTGIPSDTRIHYTDEKNHGVDGDKVLHGHDDQLSIRATALYTERSMHTTAINRRERIPIFCDEALGVIVTPVYGETQMEMEVTFRCKDRPSAEEWLNGVKRRVAMGAEENIHAIEYHYIIPDSLMVLLLEIHRLRENQAGYGEDLKTYFKNHFRETATKITDQSGKNAQSAIREKQMGIMGWFNWEGIPTLEKGDTGETWTASFIYRVEFDRITALTVEYPAMIHNQLLGTGYVDYERNYNLPLEQGLTNLTQASFWTIQERSQYMSTLHGWMIPDFDDWYPTQIPHGYLPIARLLTGVDPGDPTLVLNLNEIDGFEWEPEMLAYLQQFYSDHVHYGKSILSVRLYEGDLVVDESEVVIEPDLTIRTVNPMNLRKEYHVVVSLATDLTVMHSTVLEYLQEDGAFCQYLLGKLDPENVPPEVLQTQHGPYMPKHRFWEAIRRIPTTPSNYRSSKHINRFTVASCLVVAH